MSFDSELYAKKVPWVKRAGIVAFVGAILLPILGACGQKATPDQNAHGVTTLRFFEHDTQQTSLDLGPQGTGPGDQFIYSGDLFDHAGGRKVGHTSGQCTTFRDQRDNETKTTNENNTLDNPCSIPCVQRLCDAIGRCIVRGETEAGRQKS